MKKSILTSALAATFMFSTILVLTSCGSDEETHQHADGEVHEEMAHDEMEHNESVADGYGCPMHPEITGIAGDKCSICNMDLTEVAMAE